jgi:hypothetical protein
MVRGFTNPTEIVLDFLPLVLEISKRDLDFVLSLSGRDKIFCFHKSPFPLTVHILARGNKDAIRNRRSDGVSPRYARPDEITDARESAAHMQRVGYAAHNAAYLIAQRRPTVIS